MKIVSPWKLEREGVLGMNGRNADYVLKYNRRKFYPRVDDKLITKRLALQGGIPVPELIASVRFNHQLRDLKRVLDGESEFVIKPSQGCAGQGILVITQREGDLFIKPNGATLTLEQIKRHISDILSGLHSLGGQPDRAMIEKLIHFTDAFEPYTYQGVPDIRVIMFLGYPVMAMTRLSTSMSDGKANLHQGAVGVGLDIGNGRPLRAVQFDRPILKHPDTGNSFEKMSIERWDDILLIASRCYELTELGYMGADVVLDREKGPMILELNARPGLAIQAANGTGLKNRLEQIKKLSESRATPEQRVKIAQELFAVA
ncbi:alpha-L-glutamate ligase-like protein [Pelagicoccus mobilis]|uniref:Alpha-L-glutamate ligase-like protein n=1 Tax=Pelagicoccus mobilis TaxID=415221 RepID=A0A934S1A3_9BACT|nr:alpha-L-glutamate ligase-like protein [Pelagicoccus mobilis]MBK1878761.1 alpha-L-glutamate ligase-like protein [Pelagicoccus mobilis]